MNNIIKKMQKRMFNVLKRINHGFHALKNFNLGFQLTIKKVVTIDKKLVLGC